MATGSTAKGLDKDIRCSICKGLFEVPKLLPCLHTFCKQCLEVAVKKCVVEPKVVRCPTCHTNNKLPTNGVEGFLTNFLATDAVEIFKIHEDEGLIKCANEKIDDNSASNKCLDCDSYLCENCTTFHEKQNITQRHKVVSMADIKSGKVKQLSPRKYYCLEHEGEELKLYCRTCQNVICRDCTIVTHKHHDHDFIKGVTEELTRELMDLSSQVKQKKRDVKVIIDDAHKQKEAEQQKKITYDNKAVKFFDDRIAEDQARIADLQKHIKQLQQHRASLLKEFSAASYDHLKQLKSLEDKLEFSSTHISSALTFSQQLLSAGSSVDLTMMSQQVCSHFRMLTSLPLSEGEVKKSLWAVMFSKLSPLKSKVIPKPYINANSIQIYNTSQYALLGKNSFELRLMSSKCEQDVNAEIPVYAHALHEMDVTAVPQKKAWPELRLSSKCEQDINAEIIDVDVTTLPQMKTCPFKIKSKLYSNSDNWSVSYFVFPPCPDAVVISVAVGGVESKSITLTCQKKMAVETKVREYNTQRVGITVAERRIRHKQKTSLPVKKPQYGLNPYAETEEMVRGVYTKTEEMVYVAWEKEEKGATGTAYRYPPETDEVELSKLEILPE